MREWFLRSFDAPTKAQTQAWPAIARGENVLLSAPTGSGKTLAAFLWALDRLVAEPGEGTRLVYVSPLKALSYDIERNLRAPLKGIGADLRVGIRTGDTPQRERQQMLKTPPDILITTPESLYLMLTSRAQEFLKSAKWLIIDEVHAVARTKRGAHLALTMERLEELAEDPIQRIALSATQRPLEEVARFVVGPQRNCTVIDTGMRKPLDLEIRVPVDDMTEPDSDTPISDIADGTSTTRRSIWPAIYPELLELVQSHRSTIVFVNNRRSAERLALRLNELAGEDSDHPAEIARAHHGSLAREERLIVEDLLKSGQLPCLVATSSLELGIDMGAVDLVVQVESPKSVTAGLQRIGRAGHGPGEVAKGRIFPKFRADLLEATVVAKRMREGEIEPTVVPRNPLDVLAQQIVAIAAASEAEVPAAHVLEMAQRTYSFAELTRSLFDNVLDMLDGRYPSEEFSELRPRIVWDRVHDTIRARPGARQLAIFNAGTIPDRGLYGVHLPDGRRVGELDEEMVYEARPGQTFLLGATTWRIEEITRDRVIVTPAPGLPGAVPFWKGDSIGRPVELGRAVGEFTRWAVDKEPEQLMEAADLDAKAAKNLVSFLREQREATRVLPSDQTIVVERFRDEIGDWRLCVLSPFGGRVHSAWALALSARLRDERGLEADAIWSDDGVIVHLPDADEAPPADTVLLDPDELEDLLMRELGSSALFGARFRENAARSLLIPRAMPGKRTPLWQQRLKAQSLLEVARRFGQFPVVLETYRECLQDVFDLPALKDLLRKLHTRELSLVEVETQHASPFASSLLFDYVATYMYEGDTPNAERRAAALALDRDLLAELLGQEELRDLIDPEALDELEADLQRLSDRRKAATADQLQDVLRGIGDLTDDEVAARVITGVDAGAMLDQLEAERRAVKMRIGGGDRWVASEDAALYRDAFGAVPPGGLPEAFLEAVEEPFLRIARRFAHTHGPFTTQVLQRRYGVDPLPVLRELEREGELVRGELRPGGTEREWCDTEVLRRLRRASLAALRREVEAVEQQTLARFLAEWQGIDRSPPGGAGVDRLREILIPLQGVALTPETWERDVLPRRVGAYSTTWLDELCASGEIVWIGAGALGRSSGRVALYFRDDAAWLGRPNVRGERPEGELQDRVRERLAGGACFWSDLLVDIQDADAAELQEALWDLAWAGEVTNDAFAPLRAPRLSLVRAEKARTSRRRFGSRRSPRTPQVIGRWSLTEPLFANAPGPGERARALAELMLERYGVVTRETVRAEGITGGFSALYAELSKLETLGSARRGYFVEGLGGAQFALSAAVERLRALRTDENSDGALVIAATDPANPYGASLPWPKREYTGRGPARVPGAHVVTIAGAPVLFAEKNGRNLVPLDEPDEERLRAALEALAQHVRKGRIRQLAIERFDGEPVVGSPMEDTLIELGFRQGPRKLTLTA
ncbi:MAG: ATP-dependent helicase Lhr and Lhr-like helicase [Thermoleophilaceae bacterium]|nr:ATP-dependent helicase Lhr and Lhr-like helicase [Thermoleophilaceae bacterium]